MSESEKQAPVEKSPLKQIRTFQGDVAQALAEQNASLVSLSRAEHLKHPGNNVPEAKTRSASAYFLLGILFLVLAGFGALWAYQEFIKQTTPPAPSVPAGRFVSAESSVAIDIQGLAREEIFKKIADYGTDVRTGELRHFVLASTTIASFLGKLESNAPGSLVRASEPAFMLGSFGTSRFLLLKLSSYPNAFAGMLEWEKNMTADLSGLFRNSEMLKQNPSQSVFRDIVWKNKDARALFIGTSTEPLLLYSFFDNKYLIITDRFSTLDILIERLTREKLLR